MASEININVLTHEELVLLHTQINERIAKMQVNRTHDLIPDTEDYEDIQIRSGSETRTNDNNDSNIYCDTQSDIKDTPTYSAEEKIYNEFLKKPSIQRMSCPPPPPPIKQAAKIIDTDYQRNIKVIANPQFIRSSSIDSVIKKTYAAVPTPKPRTKLEVKDTKPSVGPKPMFNKNTSMSTLKNPSTKVGHMNGCEVTSASRMLNSEVVEEFNRLKLQDKSGGTLSRIRTKNNKLLNEASNNSMKNSKNTKELGSELSKSISPRPLPDLPILNLPTPNLQPTPKPRELLKQTPFSDNIIKRLSAISNKAIGNLYERTTSECNTLLQEDNDTYAEEECNKYNEDDEAIYESITESIYGNRRRSIKLCSEYEESNVLNTLKRGNKESGNCTLPINRRAEYQIPPALPPKQKSLQTGTRIHYMRTSDGETESETSSIYSDNTKRSSFYGERESIYLPSYPPCEGSSFYDFDIDDDTNRNYKEALDRIKQSEKIYIDQLEKIFVSSELGIYTENVGKADKNHMKELFGEIKGLLDFHKNFLKGCRSCHTLPQFGKLVVAMECDFEIYIRDQWCKSTTTISDSKHVPIFMPYRNWAENHLSMYNHLLNQFLNNNDPDIKVASTIISDLMGQCEAIHWLKEVTNFPKVQEAGKFLLKNKFRVKINYMYRGYCDVIFMEKYILCISPESQECFCHFNTSKISIAKKGPKILFIENILKEKKVTLKSIDPNIIETWYNRYLYLIHKKIV